MQLNDLKETKNLLNGVYIILSTLLTEDTKFQNPSKKTEIAHVMVSHTCLLNTAIAKYLHNVRCKIFPRLQHMSNQSEMRDKAGRTCETSLALGVVVFVLVCQCTCFCYSHACGCIGSVYVNVVWLRIV